MRVCTRCGHVATRQEQRYCARCVAPLDLPVEPLDRPVEPFSPPAAQLDAPGPGRAVVLPRSRYVAGRTVRNIYVPEVRRRPWDPRMLQADDYGDLFGGGEAETSVLTPLVIDDPVPDDDPYPGDHTRGHGGRRRRGSSPARGGRRARIASAALGVVLLLSGGLTAWAAIGRSGGLPGSGARLSSSQTPSAATPGAGRRVTVTMAPGVSQNPAAGAVRSLLASYFAAINAHRFAPYAAAFLPPARRQLNAASFMASYGSTTDSRITLVSIAPAQRGPAATVTFTATQRSPGRPGTSCTNWDITLFLGHHGPGYLLGTPPRNYHAYHRACG